MIESGLHLLERSVRALGPKKARDFGRICSRAAAPFFSREYRILEAQLEFLRHSIPALRGVSAKEFYHEVFYHISECLTEVFNRDELLRVTGKAGELYPGVAGIEATGAEVCREAALECHKGQSNLSICGHVGNFELLAAYHKLSGLPTTIAGRQPNNSAVGYWLDNLRRENGGESLLRSENSSKRELSQALLKAFKTGRTLAVLLDQDTALENYFVPFFGLDAAHPVAPLSLAIRYRAPVFTTFIVRVSPLKHREFSAPVPYDPDSETAIADILKEYCKRLENLIREYPFQYPWFHRRWRRRPGVNYSNPETPIRTTNEYIAWIRKQEPRD